MVLKHPIIDDELQYFSCKQRMTNAPCCRLLPVFKTATSESLNSIINTELTWTTGGGYTYFYISSLYHHLSLSLKHLNGLTKIPTWKSPNRSFLYPFLSIDHPQNLSSENPNSDYQQAHLFKVQKPDKQPARAARAGRANRICKSPFYHRTVATNLFVHSSSNDIF